MWTRTLGKKLLCDRCGNVFPIGASTYMKNKHNMDVSVELGGYRVDPDDEMEEDLSWTKVDFCPKCYKGLINVVAEYLTGKQFIEDDGAENEIPSETDNEDKNGETTEETENS